MQNYILDALETVNAWDLPDEDLAQARLMVGINSEETLPG